MNETNTLGAHEVATWLRRHPEFLRQFPDLAGSLVVPRESGPAASLASYQLEVLREKNRELTRRLQELFANAQDNERLTVRTIKKLFEDAIGTLGVAETNDAAYDPVRQAAKVLNMDLQAELSKPK